MSLTLKSILAGIKPRLKQPTTLVGVGIIAATWGIGLDNIQAGIQALLPFIDRIDALLATVSGIVLMIYNETKEDA